MQDMQAVQVLLITSTAQGPSNRARSLQTGKPVVSQYFCQNLTMHGHSVLLFVRSMQERVHTGIP